MDLSAGRTQGLEDEPIEGEPIEDGVAGLDRWLAYARRSDVRLGAAVGGALLVTAMMPFVPMFLGVFLVLGAALHAFWPDARPYLDVLMRVPAGSPAKRRRQLVLMAGAGVLLIVVGSVSASLRGRVRSHSQQAGMRAAAAVENADSLIDLAKNSLAVGDVNGAELILLEADGVAAKNSDQREEVDDLLARIQQSGDAAALLEILVDLPQDEFDAFRQGASVPDALEYPEPALTRRAVEIAQSKSDEAHRLRGAR